MSGKALAKNIKLYQKGKKYISKIKYNKAIEIFDKILSIDPEFEKALEMKGFALRQLGKLEESYQTFFQGDLITLKKTGDVPSDVYSIESWINGAKDLITKGQNQRASTFIKQASFLSPIENREGGFLLHHNNDKIYYYTGISSFNIDKKLEVAIVLIKKAMALNPNLKIPDDIMQKYREYQANRNGKDVEMITPLDTSNLKTIIPSNDKILCSTSAKGICSYRTYSTERKVLYKVITLSWDTHLLLTLNGIAFMVGKEISKTGAHYIPWAFVSWEIPKSGFGRALCMSTYVADFKYPVCLNLGYDKSHPPTIDGFAYVDRFKPILEQRITEMEKKIEDNLKSLDSLDSVPSYKAYVDYFDDAPKYLYDRIRKKIKKERKKK